MIRDKAITDVTKRELRIVQFVAIQKRIARIIRDRPDGLTSQRGFRDAQLRNLPFLNPRIPPSV